MSATTQTIATTTARGKDDDERARLDAELRVLVAECAKNGDLEDSVSEVLDKLDGMPWLNAHFRARAAGELVYAARNSLRAQMERQAAWTLPDRVAKIGAARMEARLSTYDWPLPVSDVRLGDAGVDDLEQAAGYHEARAASEQSRAGMYRNIAAILRKSRKQRVRDGVSEAKLAEVMRGAQ